MGRHGRKRSPVRGQIAGTYQAVCLLSQVDSSALHAASEDVSSEALVLAPRQGSRQGGSHTSLCGMIVRIS